jgi:GLPGLI family protein
MLERLSIITFLIFTLAGFSQNNGKAYYSSKPVGESNNDISENTEFVLTFNKDIAKYELNDVSTLTVDDKLAQIYSGYSGPYYFDFKNSNVFRIREEYLVQKPASAIEWTITKEQLNLNGFTCFKATAELEFRNRSIVFTKPVTAWFTPELSINAGPNGFCGLPGLIIQLEYRNTVTTLNKIKYYESPLKVRIPENKKIITEQKFDSIIRQLTKERDEN